MQTHLHFLEFDALCVDGPLQGRLYAHDQHERRDVLYLDVAQIPYRIEQGESGEWYFIHAKDLDAKGGF